MPTEWPFVSIGEIADGSGGEVRTGPFGSQLHQADYTSDPDGVPVIMPKDMVGGGITYTSIARIRPEKAQELSQHVTRAGDILVARRGEIGRCALVRYRDEGVLCGTGCIRVSVQGSAVEPEFLHRFLSTSQTASRLDGMAVGSTMANLNAGILRSLEVPLPPITAQRRIASTLRSYDDLIENNTRRIQILEEMAQVIYREWFVEFRFPGHEGVPRLDSELGPIPQRWRASPLSAAVDVNARSIRKGEEPPKINYIDIGAVTASEFSWNAIDFVDAPGRARRLVLPHDVIWSTVRPNLRAYALVCEPPDNCVASTGFAVLTARSVPWSYAYLALTTDAFVGYLVNQATGAAYPAVTGRTFERATMLIPDAETLSAFHEIVGPLYDLAAKLRAMSSILRGARDLLLPRLISGEIDVSEIGTPDMESEVAAAGFS